MKAATIFCLLLSGLSAQASDIASCSDPSGKGYFPEVGLVGQKDSGWVDEKITGGITKVAKIAENEYDVLFVDTRKDIISARRDGGRVFLLNRGRSAFSLLVVYPGATAEVYTFLKNNFGALSRSLLNRDG
jgi:hypothetical protein